MSDSLFEEIKTDELYHIYKTNSSKINTELHHKFNQYPVITDFFKHYTNIDIKLFNENINIFFLQISTIADINSLNTFNSSIDQYITDFSQLYLVLNAIVKINNSIEKIITKIKSSLPLLYNKHCLDKDYQNKINEIAKYMLNTNINKINMSSYSTNENSENSTEFKSISNKKPNIEKIELLKDLLKNNNSNHINNENRTSKFNYLDTPRFQEDLIHINEENKSIIENDDISKSNKISESKFTFMEKNNNNKEKINEKDNMDNIENEDDNIISDDINDYITSVPQNINIAKLKTIKRRGRYKSCKELNGNILKTDLDKNFHTNDKDYSEKIILNEDSKMYADLLEIIYELYKNEKITYEQKVKLKKLIIKKCPKILNVYKIYQNIDNEKLIEGLKELV